MKKHCLEILEQGVAFVDDMDVRVYTAVPDGYMSSIGAHMRHILDHFVAVRDGATCRLVDYENRRRGGDVETQPGVAREELQDLAAWAGALPDDEINQAICVRIDIGGQDCRIVSCDSSVGRELLFACSHAIHHFAMMKQMRLILDEECSCDDRLGLAPSTAHYVNQSQKG